MVWYWPSIVTLQNRLVCSMKLPPRSTGNPLPTSIVPGMYSMSTGTPWPCSTKVRPFQNGIDVTYLGEDLHLSLDLAGGERLRASVKNANAARAWAPTQSVELVVDAADLRLLSR